MKLTKKLQSAFTAAELFILLVFVGQVAFVVAILWVAWHFISKFW